MTIATRSPYDALRLRNLLGIAMLACVAHADASMICRWVDASGRTQLSDTVPEPYAKVANCTDSKQFDLSPERAQQAQQRSRQLRQQADLGGSSGPDGKAAVPAAPAPSAPAPAKRPARGVDPSTDCATWRRLYEESSACFAPFNTVGGIKAEAFARCTVIPSPDPKCGPPPN